MAEAEPPTWYADSDDPYYTLRHSGGPLVACFLIPAVLVICAGATHDGAGLAFLLPGALVPFAVIAAAWEFLLDRRAVVEIRLAGGELTLIRANRATTTYPIGEVRLVEVLRGVRDGAPAWSRMRLHVGERVERTRRGPELPPRLMEAIITAEVDLQIREKRDND